MLGRSCIGLLLVSLLLAPFVQGQSDPDFNRPLFSPRKPLVKSEQSRRTNWVSPTPPRIRRRVLFPPGTYGFPQLARAAGIIFSGTVASIEPRPSTGSHPVETVAITFRVENAIRGTTPAGTMTLSEWIGLWSTGQRYHVGDRVLLFLYPPSKLGLTSCVGGAMGRFAVDPVGRIALSAQQLSAFRADPVFGGRSRVRLSDFAWAVRASEEE